MPFWLKDPKPIHFLRPLSTSIRLLISFASFISIFTIWLLIFHLPANTHKKNIHATIHDFKKQEAMFTHALAQHKKKSQEYATCHTCFNNALSSQTGVPNSLNKIFETIKTKKIVCRKFSPHTNNPSPRLHTTRKVCNFFSKQYFDLDVKTTFKKLYSFFSSFDKFDHCIKFKNIIVASRGKNSLSAQTKLRFACFEEKNA